MTESTSPKNTTAVDIVIAACGGCGINLGRPFKDAEGVSKLLFFDTSEANARPGESYRVVTNGSGSGSNRAENARDIERMIPQFSDEQLSLTDAVIVMFSASGGSGSVLGPFLIREYAKRGARPIALVVLESDSSVGAKNTKNTLLTLTAICKNNDIVLPVILLSNDKAPSRGGVDQAAALIVRDAIDLLTKQTYEVDRNDRLAFLNPTKVLPIQPGLKILRVSSDNKPTVPKAVLGGDSQEMVDALLVIQNSPDELIDERYPLPPARLKKTGFYHVQDRRIVGQLSSDISSIEGVLNDIEHMQHADRSQKHQGIERLDVSNSAEDLYL